MNTRELKALMEAYAAVYAPHQLDELSKTTLGSYVKKASRDASDRSFDHGASERRMYDDHPDDERETKRLETRQKGINRAVNKMMKKEELDIFDAILEYLVAEGYAATNKEALVIMANMSEEWRTEIIESQYARENPEKYEREQAKKTSKKEKAMNDPHTGINSPAFAEFMRKQMGR